MLMTLEVHAGSLINLHVCELNNILITQIATVRVSIHLQECTW